MAKLWSATSLVALALLGCLVSTEVEAQDSSWQKPASPMSKGSSPPQAPQTYQPPPPRYPHTPQAPPPQAPSYPKKPQAPYPPPPQAPSYPQRPQVQRPPPPQAPSYPQRPQAQHPPPPQAPSYPQKPQVQRPPPPQAPSYPQKPQVQRPPPPQAPSYPQKPHGQTRPQQDYQSPQSPQYPQRPQVQHPSPPQVPKYPQAPKLPPRTPPKSPQYPQAPKYPFPRGFPDMQSPGKPQLPQLQQQHNQPTAPSNYQASVPKQPSFDSCEVGESQKIPCGFSGISPDACERLSCCFDGRRCYFAKAVTVHCTKDAYFIVIVARDSTLPNIDVETVSLLGQGQGCTHVDTNSVFAIYYFPVAACGTVVMEEPGVIVYENRMSSAHEVEVGPGGVITRDSKYELLFQCRYTSTSIEALAIELIPQDPLIPVAALGPVRVQLRLANGQCISKGCNEVDVAYSSFFTEADYPVTKVLRDPVYVEVQILERTDPSVVLTLGHCWTTTTPNPHSLPQWDILIDGCPYSDDRYLSLLVPVGPPSGLAFPGHYRRFIFKMFAFVDPNAMEPLREQVYIHCSTAICMGAPGRNCEPTCYRKKRDVTDADTKEAERKVVVSVGPVIMTTPGE